MNFIKTFLAGLLAVVVGTFLVFFLWIFILLGIAGSMEKSVAVHPESILKIDFSEVLTDAPVVRSAGGSRPDDAPDPAAASAPEGAPRPRSRA